ncbi:NrfD/PsrC family molybdoenzyme membrane anchor subunit [Benzoatithermus flavus]|uniref:NrfD/PsrC family molybdoenzyme membrane anchor subunit n=1 Tax=Benzoatithermus flavus TaxID=3108223 RepID=A0ABU8XS03_9PROT
MAAASPPRQRRIYRLPEGHEFRTVTEQVAAIPLHYPQRLRWWLGFIGSSLLLGLLIVSAAYLFSEGIGVWGNTIPVNWGIAISNTVWFIGIGHAGTFISALLLLTQQHWRNSLNRFAEAMTLLAATCAASYPLFHLGRPFFFYWVVPYPNTMALWPQFRSPLVWDFFAFATYITVSLIFWYIGLVPDLAAVRDRATRRLPQVLFGIFALGWRGSAVHWERWRRAYLLVAVVALPLVVSVHSGVSLLFAVGQIPGWHTTVFPPYFVLGAVFSGFAVVIMIAITLRHAFRLYDLVTRRHLELLGLWLLATGWMTAYGYLADAFMAWYSGDSFERGTLLDRLAGPFWPIYWGAVICNFVPLQALWFPRPRRSSFVLFVIAFLVTVGMWFERYMLVISGLFRDFLPSSWGGYVPTFWDWGIFFGLIGFFLFFFFLFVRFLPAVSMFEIKEAVWEEEHDT